MEWCYDVALGNQIIGSVRVIREGLYYHFCCVCCLSGDVMYQLTAVCNGKEISLGVCVPVPGGFGVDTRIPVKAVGEGDFSFYAVPKHSNLRGKFVAIRAEEPFAYIDRLMQSRLMIQNGDVGVWIADT